MYLCDETTARILVESFIRKECSALSHANIVVYSLYCDIDEKYITNSESQARFKLNKLSTECIDKKKSDGRMDCKIN